MAPALAAPREQIESTFVTVGARLAEGATMLNRITKVFEALPAELQSPELGEASTRLAEVGRRAQTISGILCQRAGRPVRNSSRSWRRPTIRFPSLRRTVKMMGIVAINARVVAAGIVGDSDDFDVFTTDIAKLSESASTTIQDFTAVYRQLTDEVGQAARQREPVRERDHCRYAERACRQHGCRHWPRWPVSAPFRSKAAPQTGRVSRQIVGRIASAVMALQVGDATRQRIEHVEAGIETLCDLLDGGTLSDDDAQAAQSSIGGLQAAQLTAATDAFENDVAEAGGALRRPVGRCPHHHGAQPLHLRRWRRIPAGGPERAPCAMPPSCCAIAKAERGKLELVASAVLRTVGVLLSHVEAVQEIEANMRLVSLNAAVKCAQLGPRGAALNVIARQLRELTGETVAAAEAAMAGLHDAAGLAQSFGAAANGDAAGRVGQLEQEATVALLLLQGVDRSLAEALGTLERDGPNVIALLGHAAETFADQAAISETMRDLEMRIVAECPPGPAAAPAAIAAVISGLRTRYTMDAERKIHEQLFGKEAVAAAAPNEEVEEVDLDDLFL